MTTQYFTATTIDGYIADENDSLDWLSGGGDLVGQFDDAGLLDEVILGVAPVTLGAGAPVLPRRILSSRLTLTGARRLGPFAYLTYDVLPPS